MILLCWSRAFLKVTPVVFEPPIQDLIKEGRFELGDQNATSYVDMSNFQG